MQQSTIRLLILNDSAAEAERLISMLQNAGRSVRAKHVDSDDALNKLLDEKIWDLMIAMDATENISPSTAQKLIRRQNKDVPLILLTDREDNQASVEGLKLGARDVIRLDEDQHLLLVIERELNNRAEREKRRTSERRVNDIVERNQQLLESSRDAIAFIQDGMFLYANESFADLLAYDDRDDLECSSVIDIVKPDGHEAFKSFIKHFTLKADETEDKLLELDIISANGDERKISFHVMKAVYDEESCIQFLHKAKEQNTQALEAKIEQIKTLDQATGLFNTTYLTQTLNKLIKSAVDKHYNSALFHIGIDHFQDIVSEKLGISASEKALAAISQLTKENVKRNDVLCRYGDDAMIVVIPKISATSAQERANELGSILRDSVVSVEDKTLHFNYHIGISLINETSANIDLPIEQSILALEQARQNEDDSIIAVLFEKEEEAHTERNIANEVQAALNNGKFRLLFQPILSLRGAEKEHYEVLLRMLDKEENEISPKEFLAEAAEINATTKIDRWVILEATKILSAHRKSGNDTHLILHLSKESMMDESFAPWLNVVFKAAELPTEAIIFQLNEVDINDHLNTAANFTQAIKKTGCGISVNHFGCAMNHFKALDSITSDYIKIDGSFTQDLQNNESGIQSLNEIVSELHQKGKITIVPFVENASLLSKLWQSGVHYIQGYYLQGPAANMDYDFDMES